MLKGARRVGHWCSRIPLRLTQRVHIVLRVRLSSIVDPVPAYYYIVVGNDVI